MPPICNPNDPVIWETYGDIQLMDITLNLFDKVKDFIIEDIRRSSVIFRERSADVLEAFYKDFWKSLNYFLIDRCSLVAINIETQEIIGVVVLKVMRWEAKTWSSLEFLCDSVELKAIMELYKHMAITTNTKKNPHFHTQLNDCLHIIALCVNPDYKGLNWKMKLIDGAARVASSMFIEQITYVAFSIANQRRAVRAGMIEIFRVYYAHYIDKHHAMPFIVKLRREWYAKLYVRHVVKQIPYMDL